MGRKLICEIFPFLYQPAVLRCVLQRKVSDLISKEHFAKERLDQPLDTLIYSHNSLIRRKLGDVDMRLQENKAVNLSLAAPHVNGILIKPGETFSFWRLVGNCSASKGYKTGLTINAGNTSEGIGGGMCQFTNLIHWMVLHSELTITEHHHHDGIDMFPDYHRMIPFGTGTSVAYNYVDYRFKNNTERTYQLLVHTTSEYLCGELRSDREQEFKYHIRAEEEYFSRENDGVYRNGKIFRLTVDRRTGNTVKKELLRENHARVLYDTRELKIRETM